MESGATKPAQRAPYEISAFGSGTFRVTETKTGRPVFFGPKSVAEKWLKELSGAYVLGVEYAIGQTQDAQFNRFERGELSERGEVLNGRNPRGDARLLGALASPEDVSDARSAPLVSLKQGDYRQDISPRDVIGGGR